MKIVLPLLSNGVSETKEEREFAHASSSQLCLDDPCAAWFARHNGCKASQTIDDMRWGLCVGSSGHDHQRDLLTGGNRADEANEFAADQTCGQIVPGRVQRPRSRGTRE